MAATITAYGVACGSKFDPLQVYLANCYSCCRRNLITAPSVAVPWIASKNRRIHCLPCANLIRDGAIDTTLHPLTVGYRSRDTKNLLSSLTKIQHNWTSRDLVDI